MRFWVTGQKRFGNTVIRVRSMSGKKCLRKSRCSFFSLRRCTEKKRAVWTVGTVSELSETGARGSVRAKFDVTASPSLPHVAALSFACDDTTCSGIEMQLLGPGYRASLVKKRVVSGEPIAFADYFQTFLSFCAF